MQVTALYTIVSSSQVDGPSERSLAAAAKAAGLEYHRLVVEDTALDDIVNMEFTGHNLLYRVRVGGGASTIESALLTLHADKFTSTYVPKPQHWPSKQFAETLEQIAAGLPIVPTRFVDKTWSHLSDDELTTKADQLGSFPVLFKTLGLAHGQGVQRLASLGELKPAILLANERAEQAILREYLPEYRHFRIIVVDKQAVAAIEYHKPADDFRTNAVDVPNVTAVDMTLLDPLVLDIALRSVELYASLVGGVDVLVDTTKNVPYLAEVNVPCNFSRAEGPTGVDIGSLIVAAMLRIAAAKH